MEVLPAPEGAVMMMILLLIGICKEKKEKLKVDSLSSDSKPTTQDYQSTTI